MNMKHSSRQDLHERLIRMYSTEMLDPDIDPEVRDQIQKKINKTVMLQKKLADHLATRVVTLEENPYN
jgi:hypothetical protein